MPISPETLERAVWARLDQRTSAYIRNWRTGRWSIPKVRAIFGRSQHNYHPIFCLPRQQRVPLLRTRLALPRHFKGILSLPVVQIQLSFCAPVAVYGEGTLQLSAQGYAFDFLKLSQLGHITTPKLLPVANTVETRLRTLGIEWLTPSEAAQTLPAALQAWNRQTVLDALFMPDDYPY